MEDFTRLSERPVPESPVPRMDLPEWRERYGVVAGITTAERGFDLGLFGQGAAGDIVTRWIRFLDAMRPGFPGVVVGRQVHGSKIQVHAAAAGWKVVDGVDGHITLDPGQLLAITVADCVPVYVIHPPSGVLGLLHAGWRGVAAGVIETGIREIGARGGGDRHELILHCGVSICGVCYEVGCEVVRAVLGREVDGPTRLDLRSAIGHRAERLGVQTITVSPWCAAHDSGRFFSHRRSGGSPGRMVAYLGRPVA